MIAKRQTPKDHTQTNTGIRRLASGDREADKRTNQPLRGVQQKSNRHYLTGSAKTISALKLPALPTASSADALSHFHFSSSSPPQPSPNTPHRRLGPPFHPRTLSQLMGNAKSMSLGPEAAAVVTKAVSQMPTPSMVETGIFAAGSCRNFNF